MRDVNLNFRILRYGRDPVGSQMEIRTHRRKFSKSNFYCYKTSSVRNTVKMSTSFQIIIPKLLNILVDVLIWHHLEALPCCEDLVLGNAMKK